MKFKKNFKKGFTLVELIVVIAIVAILAAVSVVSYIAFIKQANESADIQLVKQLNIALQADEALNGTRPTMYDMLGSMEENGFVVENLTKTKSGYDIVWDQEHNRFGLLNGKDLVYGESTYNSAKAWNIWKFADTEDEAKNKSYSVYLTEEFAKTGVTELNIKAGLDVGNNAISTINYVNDAEHPQTVVIRTMGQECEFTVDAGSDTVNHYGYASTVNVLAVDTDHCYNEFGTTRTLNATAGKIVIQNTGIVFNLQKTEGSSATFQSKGGNIMRADEGTLPSSNTFNINNYEQFISFRDATNSGENFAGITVELNCDIELNGPWTPISNYWRKDNTKSFWFSGTFDGNEHTISNLTNENILVSSLRSGHNSSSHTDTEYAYGLFAATYNANFHDIIFKEVNIIAETAQGVSNESVAALVGYCYGDADHTSTISGIKVYGSISAVDVAASVAGTVRCNASISDCYSEAVITSGNRGAGIVGTITRQDFDFKAEISSCDFEGTVVCTKTEGAKTAQTNTAAGLFTYNNDDKILIKVKDLSAKTNCVTVDSEHYKFANIYQHQNNVDTKRDADVPAGDWLIISARQS